MGDGGDQRIIKTRAARIPCGFCQGQPDLSIADSLHQRDRESALREITSVNALRNLVAKPASAANHSQHLPSVMSVSR